MSQEEEDELMRWHRWHNTRLGLQLRTRTVLDWAHGLPEGQVAERHNTSQQTVSKWRHRFARQRLVGLCDAPRLGQPWRHYNTQVQEILDVTLNRRSKETICWSVRTLAKELDAPRD